MKENKGNAITVTLTAELAAAFGCPLSEEEVARTALELSDQHEMFANTKTPHELEMYSRQTVKGIGYFQKGRKKGFVLVDNEAKSGLEFPGGRVRLGESPVVRLEKEYIEETGLECEVSADIPVAEFFVGEKDKHLFSGYEVKITGGTPRVNYEKGEPIVEVLMIDEDTLEKLCRTGGVLKRSGMPDKGILPNHRRIFLQYLAARRGA